MSLLQNVYPDHKWVFWWFNSVPWGSWDKKENQREYMDSLGRKLGYQTMEDWYKITWEEMYNLGGSGLLKKHGSRLKLLKSVYPNHKWTHKFLKPAAKQPVYWQAKSDSDQTPVLS